MSSAPATESFDRTEAGPRRAGGFTLIELLIVIALMAFLASLAIPIYLQYATRSKIAEAVTLAAPLQRESEVVHSVLGSFPESNHDAGAGTPDSYRGNHVDSITIGACGFITVALASEDFAGGTLVLAPSDLSGNTVWTCASDNVPHHLLPGDCRNSVPVPDCP